MLAVKAYYDGHAFITESPVAAEINQEAIITILDSKAPNSSAKDWLLGFVGSISREDCLEMEKALEETDSFAYSHSIVAGGLLEIS
jgi:hypothetical protein